MNQIEIGKFISRKRKEKGLTQEVLSEKIGVSNKTISKWECGKCMPDYSVIQQMCKELDITLYELINAGEDDPDNIKNYNDEQILDLIKKTQAIQNQRISLYGIILIIMGIALMALSSSFGESNLNDFLSGLLIGLSIGSMLVGIFVVGKGLSYTKK